MAAKFGLLTTRLGPARQARLRAAVDQRTTIELETPYTAREVATLADVVHGSGDQAASISSGSFRTDGMIIAPCSMNPRSAADGRIWTHAAVSSQVNVSR